MALSYEGKLTSWDSFDDPTNSVNRPLQMGRVWMEAKNISRMPMNHKLWFHDSAQPSFPACMAVKSAGLQSPELDWVSPKLALYNMY